MKHTEFCSNSCPNLSCPDCLHAGHSRLQVRCDASQRLRGAQVPINCFPVPGRLVDVARTRTRHTKSSVKEQVQIQPQAISIISCNTYAILCICAFTCVFCNSKSDIDVCTYAAACSPEVPSTCARCTLKILRHVLTGAS